MDAVLAKGADTKQTPQRQVPTIPFTHAAHEQMEMVSNVANAVAAGAVKIPPIDVPARGYVRSQWIRSKGSAGNKGPAAVHEDFPFCVLDSLAFFDVGGGEIYNPLSGYETFLVNKYGGYAYMGDPTQHPDYDDDEIAWNFALRIPFEISAADALGCLSNQNTQSKYKLNLTQADKGSIYTTDPTGQPTNTLDIYSELWSQPPKATDKGAGIAFQPPLVGTTQYWTRETKDLSAGTHSVEISRRGNQVRNFILIWRETASGLRADATFPDPVRFVWDSREQFEELSQYRRQVMYERYGVARGALDRGVYVYDFAHDVLGHPGGMDDGHLWLRTKSSSRLEFRGTFGAAGTLTILINDVAPVAVTDQYSEGSVTGGATVA